MSILLATPSTAALADVVGALAEWQSDDAAFQLHPGDVSWFARFGAEATAAALRTWSRDGRIVAIALLDGADTLRLTIAPDVADDDELARAIAADVDDESRGVLAVGEAYLEAPSGLLVRDVLAASGWNEDEAWTPLERSLTEPAEQELLRVELVTPDRAADRVAVQRAAFANSIYTVDAWAALAAGPTFAEARDLIGYDTAGAPVAAITVWSAGPGRPGLIEPMGIDREHAGRGYGTAITLAGAAALRELGSSSAQVCTKSSNAPGIATYRKAGFSALPERLDLARRS